MTNEIKQQAEPSVSTCNSLNVSPEVVLKQDMGLPMDIWIVGCVVVEMATGKVVEVLKQIVMAFHVFLSFSQLPWADFDHEC